MKNGTDTIDVPLGLLGFDSDASGSDPNIEIEENVPSRSRRMMRTPGNALPMELAAERRWSER